ncbi:thioredoxin [Aspergillus pseudonomiae]|uniref:Thioredoxin n=1 Tax=Aspergillus pseudonomiae TaxID=1506151 RepID=A0A5N6HST3_9EURO|nr:thioredoxin [Aspergillus pseudonomiae]KAB8256450.1 thioredoxin [Aspergillus pseudonomiae]KAE8400291.1 thioredoxin [Aspergillus pseudonomiae]
MPTNLESSDALQEALKSENLVVINCHAVWNGPSRLFAPKFVHFAREYPQVGFYMLNVDEVSNVAAELGVRAMPTFYFFRNGEKVGEVIGANPAAVKAAIDKYHA